MLDILGALGWEESGVGGSMAGCSQLSQHCCESCRISNAPLNCGTGTDPGPDPGSGEAQAGASLSSGEGRDTQWPMRVAHGSGVLLMEQR